MREYYHDPESTAQALEGGWFHTGDIGELSPDGFLRITDRKKDLIKTAGGKYVAPQRLEGLLKTNRYISQVHIHGDQRKFVVALVTLNADTVKAHLRESGQKEDSNLAENPRVRELIRKAIAEANTHLASWESIKGFAIVPREFSIEAGEVTPSLKVKRKVVDRNFHEMIEKLYSVER
jgi:long-chain acyl-CoA synthetase